MTPSELRERERDIERARARKGVSDPVSVLQKITIALTFENCIFHIPFSHLEWVSQKLKMYNFLSLSLARSLSVYPSIYLDVYFLTKVRLKKVQDVKRAVVPQRQNQRSSAFPTAIPRSATFEHFYLEWVSQKLKI